MDNKLQESVKTLIEALKTDGDYRNSWKASIAMAFKDEYKKADEYNDHDRYEGFIVHNNIHEIANKSADNFLNLLCS